jgi:hypothetical protein
MASIAQMIERELLSWPGVTAQPHRFGGVEFQVNNHEIGHLHGSRQADLPFPRRVRDSLLAEGRASPHHILPETGWVSFYIRGKGDTEAAIALFRRNYERLAQRSSADVVGETPRA